MYVLFVVIYLIQTLFLLYSQGELFRKIVYLDYLAKYLIIILNHVILSGWHITCGYVLHRRHFDYEIWYIKHCTEELRGIRTLLPRNRNKITAVRREMEQLRSTVHLLHGQTDNSLTRIDRLFLDSDPREGVGELQYHSHLYTDMYNCISGIIHCQLAE